MVRGCSCATPGKGPALLLRAPFRQYDLVLQKIGELDSLSFERLGIKRGLGQTRQRVGFEINRPPLGNNEVRTGIATAR